MRPERPLRSGASERPRDEAAGTAAEEWAVEHSGIGRELGAIGMTIDPGAKQDLKPWTTFTQQQDIPDWIAKAYIESYRGPHGDEPGCGGNPGLST